MGISTLIMEAKFGFGTPETLVSWNSGKEVFKKCQNIYQILQSGAEVTRHWRQQVDRGVSSDSWRHPV
jgi:hypothetical protein